MGSAGSNPAPSTKLDTLWAEQVTRVSPKLRESDNILTCMKITVGQFKQLVREAAQDANDEKSMLISVYSDAYKERNGIRPRWKMDDLNKMSVSEIETEINNLYDMPGGDDDDSWEPAPSEYDYPPSEAMVTPDEDAEAHSMQNMPSRSGMGRRG